MNPWVRVAIEETTLCNRGAVLPNYGLELKGLETWKGTQPCGGALEDQILFYLTFLLLLIFHSTGVSFICLRTIVCPCLRPASFARFIQLVRPWQTTTRVPYVPRAKISSKSVIFSTPIHAIQYLTFHFRSQAALSDPFSVPNLPRVAPFQPTAPPVNTEPAPAGPSDEVLSPTATTATSPESSVSPAEFDAWQAEYSSQVAEWRRQSATVRARAEVERARWEERRAREQEEGRSGDDGQQQPQDTCTSNSEWEAVSHRSSTDAPVSVTVSTPAPAPAPAPLPPLPPPSQPVAPSQVNVPSSFPFPPSVVIYF